MNELIEKEVIFMEGLDIDALSRYGDHVLHVMPTKGCFDFELNHRTWHSEVGSYVIMPNPLLASRLAFSDQFDGYIFFISYRFLTRFTPNSNYGIFGRIANLRHPVITLAHEDFQRCLEDLQMMSRRIAEADHLFHYERIGALMQNHVLDLYDIHARIYQRREIPKRAGELMLQFIKMLDAGEYRKTRDLSYYASRLCIVPHYLTEICIKTSGMPASYWIETYTRNDIIRQLRDRSLSFTDIADRLHFSSLSYFTRFVKKTTGMTPSEFRSR